MKKITFYKDPFPVLDLDSKYCLRERLSSDAEDFLDYYSDVKVNQYVLTTPPKTLEDAKSEMNYCYNLFKHQRGIYWVIAQKGNDRMIGAIGLYINSFHRRAEIFYDLSRSFWRKGIMTKAINSVTDFAFNTIGVLRIEGVTMMENSASINLLKKCGFSYEGRLHNYKYHKERPYDVELLALTKKTDS